MNETEYAFPLSAGDRAHLAAASREPAHHAALLRRIEEQQASTRALLAAGGRAQAIPAPAVIRPLRLVPRPRSAPDDQQGGPGRGAGQ